MPKTVNIFKYEDIGKRIREFTLMWIKYIKASEALRSAKQKGRGDK